ncbi:hypothetical protein LX15_000553 [Streptoalloteichus tenebrarius]|uniref:Uncharacterized protein n=1 Tax=Streptoalloteichus tenebrarius (strain ATCC 17920 / DSM 40477 / JCM 4838 / CBS 697.72 / NBRC 16177 / NCIMB 11028 / NRRL B-12390 / A12253. 1 / ISP 5477) TaxID=1933 RepID=A0ABT1HMY2_STRSD|nr:hypothetical protein [Streptoalloteichus tenebrarius]
MSWRGAGWRLSRPAGRPGSGREGFGTPGQASCGCGFRNPRRTRAGVSRRTGAGVSPGAAQIGGEVAGEAELGVGGEQQPAPAVGRLRVPERRSGPAKGLCEHAEGVLDIEPARERPPRQIDPGPGEVGAGVPEPDGVRRSLWRADARPVAGSRRLPRWGRLGVVACPGDAVGQAWARPVPGSDQRRPVRAGWWSRWRCWVRPRCSGRRRRTRCPGGGVCPSCRAGERGRARRDPVRAHPRAAPGSGDRPARGPVGGRRSPRRRPVGSPDPRSPVAGGDQPLHGITDLPGGHARGVVVGREPDRVQRRGPRRTPGFQGHDQESRASRGPSCAGACPDCGCGTGSDVPPVCASGRSQQVTSTASTSRLPAARGSGTPGARVDVDTPRASAAQPLPCPRRCSPVSDSSPNTPVSPACAQ